MLAAVATFVGGAVFSIYDGVHTLVAGEDLGDPLISYIVLGVAFLLEGYSLRTGVRQARGEAARFDASFKRYLRYTPDTAVKAVVLEDSAALVGLVLAAGGLLGGQLTGSGAWDGIASSASASCCSTSPGCSAAPTPNSSSAAPSPRPCGTASGRNCSGSNTSRPYWS